MASVCQSLSQNWPTAVWYVLITFACSKTPLHNRTNHWHLLHVQHSSCLSDDRAVSSIQHVPLNPTYAWATKALEASSWQTEDNGTVDSWITDPQPAMGWLGSWVVSLLDSGAEGPGFKLQSRRCRVTVLGKLFTPIVPLFTKQQNW